MSVGHVLLGVLAEGPAHGYDLKRVHDHRFPGARQLAAGQVYQSLSRLQRDGLVEEAGRGQDGGPERTTYALTQRGENELLDWLGETEAAGPYPAEELVRKVITALHLHRDAAGFLRRQRAVHLRRMRELLSVQAATTDVAERVALDHSIFHLDADLRWLEAAGGRIADTGGGR